jgi:hypothetical protein
VGDRCCPISDAPRGTVISPTEALATAALRVYDPPMATNTGSGSRKGAVRERVQALNPVTKRYVKIDTSTGRIVDHKKTPGPYKGVREITTKKK